MSYVIIKNQTNQLMRDKDGDVLFAPFENVARTQLVQVAKRTGSDPSEWTVDTYDNWKRKNDKARTARRN